MNRHEAGIPENPVCADCGIPLTEPFRWCSNCAKAYCANCGENHFCLPVCQSRGCLAGFCVRQVSDGQLGPWRTPVQPKDNQ